ncbi:unnamed protein product [Microthlaspi erraticum]|uniref:Uncharacterized protein n=1 Tax=Microthlaspi erraticum TaxID=1685480 RepID=A0A6D2KHS9_9BRAS|nr:unnamed protein product [Microthlaspi erraticum]
MEPSNGDTVFPDQNKPIWMIGYVMFSLGSGIGLRALIWWKLHSMSGRSYCPSPPRGYGWRGLCHDFSKEDDGDDAAVYICLPSCFSSLEQQSFLIWMLCFLRQFRGSIRKSDYFALQ